MRNILAILIILALTPMSLLAWWETWIDTVESRYPNGQLQQQYQQVTFEGNERTLNNGFYRSWYENGKPEWDGQYFGGQKSQTWVRWDSLGRRMEEISYQVGLKHGMEIEWNPNSTLKKSLRYRNDKLHGLCVWYDSTNNINTIYNNPCIPMLAELLYIDGMMTLPIHDTTVDPCTGGLVGGREPYYNVENDLWIEWDKNKTKFYIGHQVEGKKHGIWTLWSAGGDIIKVDVYNNGQQLEF